MPAATESGLRFIALDENRRDFGAGAGDRIERHSRTISCASSTDSPSCAMTTSPRDSRRPCRIDRFAPHWTGSRNSRTCGYRRTRSRATSQVESVEPSSIIRISNRSVSSATTSRIWPVVSGSQDWALCTRQITLSERFKMSSLSLGIGTRRNRTFRRNAALRPASAADGLHLQAPVELYGDTARTDRDDPSKKSGNPRFAVSVRTARLLAAITR